MKQKIKLPIWTLSGLLAFATTSCKKPNIKGEEISVQQVSVAFNAKDGQVKIPDGENSYSKNAATVDVPLEIKLSDAAPAIFDIGITVNTDTVAAMIANNTLSDAVLLSQENFTLPYLVTVPFGAETASFSLKVNLSAFEKNYGKKLAVAVQLSGPTKNNMLDATKRIVVVLISTTDIIPVNQIHYVYFQDAGKTINVPDVKVKNYAVGPGTLQVPVSVSYTSTAGKSFYLHVKPNADTLSRLIAAGGLPGVEALNAADFTLPDSIAFKDFNNSLSFPVNISLSALLQHAGKKVALALDLTDPSVFKLDSTKRTLIVVADPGGLKYNPYSGTALPLSAAVGSPVTIKAADFDLGGEGWGYHDNDPANRGGTYRMQEGVDVENNGGNIGFTANGEWLKYTVESPVDGDYDVGIALSTPNSPGNVHLEVDDVNQTGQIPFTNTGGWSNWNYVHGTIHLTPGKHLVKFVWEAGDTNLKDFVYTRKN
ncbi:carbohydrate-binding protein [Chitinophaga sp. 30R24]|uniref:carbohydrate-binding protein n=1 Tax=Chitinophaga sp. 30R24 TaxID=3248838 RepID=UPI003B9099E2